MHPAPVFILGMHRSGTTLLTRLLVEMGFFMGTKRDTNEETHLLIHANEQVMHRAGATWDAPMPTLAALTPERLHETEQHFLHTLTAPELCFFMGERRYVAARGKLTALEEPWGAKDPRLTFTLPLWQRQFPQMKIIHLIRHGVDVAASLRVRHRKLLDGVFTARGLPMPAPETPFWTGIVRHTSQCLDLEYGLRLWQHYVTTGKQRVAELGANALELHYETLLENSKQELTRLADFLTPPKAPDFQALAQMMEKEKAFRFRGDAELVAFAEKHAEILDVK